jgi:hypothetical protein
MHLRAGCNLKSYIKRWSKHKPVQQTPWFITNEGYCMWIKLIPRFKILHGKHKSRIRPLRQFKHWNRHKMNLKCTQRHSSSNTNAHRCLFHPADSTISIAHVNETVSSPKLFRPVLGPSQPPFRWVPRFFPGDKATGAWRWPLISN